MATRLENGILNAMVDTGRAQANWRVKIVGISKTNRNSDFSEVLAEVYKPRSRKPDVIWSLTVNDVKCLIYWDKSKFNYQKQ